jgi:hypothetical protein
VSASNRRIDHLVLAVHELDRAAARYARPGFIVGARNRNPWGTENRVIQLRSSFLELIAVADPDLIPPPAAPLRLRRLRTRRAARGRVLHLPATLPKAVWSSDLQQHSNGATNVVDVSLDVALPADHCLGARVDLERRTHGDG